MANTDITTTKIDRDSLSKLKMLAEREKRSQPNQLAIIINHAFATTPSEISDVDVFDDMMNALVENSENGVVTNTALENASLFSTQNRISWGEEDGKVIGVLADGRRCDINGKILA